MGGHFEEFPDINNNYVAGGLYKLVDYTPFDETPEDEITHTWWIVRREIAWAAKVPENDLPPIYGPSQVCDFEQNATSSEFTVYGNSKTADGIISLDLYYRHSIDNETWSEWFLFDSDVNSSDGWSWEFNSPNGSGTYQFYSIRVVENGGIVETEKVPVGPDAIVHL